MSKGLRLVAGIALIAVAVFVPGLSAAVALNLGLLGGSLALGAVLEPKPGSTQRLQQQSVMIRSSVEPQQIVYGRTKKSGVVALYFTSGTNNRYLWFVIVAAEHLIDGYEKLHIDTTTIDIATEIDGSGYVTHTDFVNADGDKLVKTGFYVGEDSQTADAELIAAFPQWTSAHQGNGVAYFWVRLEIDDSKGGTDPENPEANVWHKGYPRDVSTTLRGALVYDPREAGHLVDDASTWAWSENSALCRADYLRSSRFGPGYLSSEIDWTVCEASADIADEQVEIDTGVYQDRYTMNGVVTVDATPKSIIESMQSADYGTTLFLADGVHIKVGAWEASSHSIDETWLAAGYSATSATETDNAYNAVRGQYLSADDDYTLVEFNPRLSAAYETEDGVGRIWQDIILPFTTEEYRAQRLGIIELKKSRQQTILQVQCNFRAEQVIAHEIVTIDLPGFSSDTFRVIGKASSTNGITTLNLREEVLTDWTFTLSDLAEPPIIPTITRDPEGVPAPSGLAATTDRIDGIGLTWTLPDMQSVDMIEVYASETNDRSLATQVTRTRSESYFHELAAESIRYYWIIARGYNNLTSDWHPLLSNDGVLGTAGTPSVWIARNVTLRMQDQTFEYDTSKASVKVKKADDSTVAVTNQFLNASGDKFIANPSPSYTAVNATVFNNVSATVYYEFLVDNVSQQNTTSSFYVYFPPSDVSGMPQNITVNVREDTDNSAILASDQVTAVGLVVGGDALNPVLSNDNHSVKSDSDGLPTELTGTGTTIELWQGAERLEYVTGAVDSGEWRITARTKTFTGTLPTLPSGGAWAIIPDILTWTSTAELSAYIEYEITYKRLADTETSVLYVRQQFTKALSGVDGLPGADGADGADGINARAVNLVANDQSIEYSTADDNPSPATTNIVATPVNYTGTPYFEYFLNDVSVQNGTSATYSYTPQADYADMPDKVEVQLRENGTSGTVYARDQVTMFGIKPGQDSPVIILSNETHALPADNDGNITSYLNSGTDIEVWDGVTQVPYDGSAPYDTPSFRVAVAYDTNITADATPTTSGLYTRVYDIHSAMTAATAVIAYDVTVKNSAGVETTFRRLQTFTTSNEGATGVSAGLSNPSPSVYADIEGFNYAVTSGNVDGLSGEFEVVKNNTKLTGGDMFKQGAGWTTTSQVNYRTINGLKIEINEDTGAYSCSVASPFYNVWTSTAVTVSLQATVDGVVYSRDFTPSKALGGSSLSIQSKSWSFSAVAFSGTATIKFKLDNDGYMYYQQNLGSWVSTNKLWRLQGSSGDYSAQATIISGTPTGTFGSFQDLGTDRNWSLSTTTGHVYATIQIEIQRDTTSEVLSTFFVTMDAELDVT